MIPTSGSRSSRGASVALALVLGLLAALTARQLSSHDLGFHLAAGNWILDGHGWPDRDPFTYTVNDRPYVDTSWGYQVVVASIERGAGAAGVVLFHVALVLVAFGGLAWTQARVGCVSPWVPVVLLIGGLASEPRFEARPELLSWCFLVVLLHLLRSYAERGRPRLAWLVPLFLLWANMHGLFILGWVVLVCFAVGESLRRRAVSWPLVGWGAAGVAACLVNPYGVRAPLFALSLATRMRADNVFAQSITEFQSPISQLTTEQLRFYPWSLGCLVVWLLLLAPSAAVALRERRYASVLLIGAFLVPGLTMVRNTPLVVLVGFASVVALAERLAPASGAAARRVAAATALLALALTARVVTDAYYVDGRRDERFGVAWNGLKLPVTAVDWTLQAGVEGPVLNHLNFGAYLMWARPDPVFIDGRLEVIGEAFFQEYRHALGSPAGLEAAVAHWGIRWIIFPYDLRPDLLGGLSRDPRWTLVYVDHLAAVYSRSGSGAEPRIDPRTRREADGSHAFPDLDTLPGLGTTPRPNGFGVWLGGFVRRQTYPTRAFKLGVFHYHRRDAAGAAARFAEAIRLSHGRHVEAYGNLATALLAAGRVDEAARCYRVYLRGLSPLRRKARRETTLRLQEIEEHLRNRG